MISLIFHLSKLDSLSALWIMEALKTLDQFQSINTALGAAVVNLFRPQQLGFGLTHKQLQSHGTYSTLQLLMYNSTHSVKYIYVVFDQFATKILQFSEQYYEIRFNFSKKKYQLQQGLKLSMCSIILHFYVQDISFVFF